jgi:hypothetical protein
MAINDPINVPMDAPMDAPMADPMAAPMEAPMAMGYSLTLNCTKDGEGNVTHTAGKRELLPPLETDTAVETAEKGIMMLASMAKAEETDDGQADFDEGYGEQAAPREMVTEKV